MIQFKEALLLIEHLAQQAPLETEVISLENADGRICSKDILSPEAVPSFNNSAMDGFAICSEDTQGTSEQNPLHLFVASHIAAGDEILSYSPRLRALEIMTGAPVPETFDAVVKIEDVKVDRGGPGAADQILIKSSVPKGNNIRKKGEDYQLNQMVLPRGTTIRAESMMALASLGISEVSVFKKPAVAILSTGKELVPLATKHLRPGMIRNSTAIYLKTALNRLEAQVISVETMGDDVESFKAHVQRCLTQNIDVLVTTGAVSMGRYDFIVPTLQKMGAEIIFHKVAIRPGKPILLANIHRTRRNPLVVFGMPGNPVSSAVGFRFFLAPFFRKLNGQKDEQALQVKLSKTISKPKGLKCFFKARLEKDEAGVVVRPLEGQASFMVSSLVQANAWVLFSENENQVDKNENVSVYSLLPNQSFELEDL